MTAPPTIRSKINFIKVNLDASLTTILNSASDHASAKTLFRDQPKTRNRFHQVPIGSVVAGNIWLVPKPKPGTEAYKQHSVGCRGLRETPMGIPDQIILEQNSFSANVIRAVIKRPPGIAITLCLSSLKNPQTLVFLIKLSSKWHRSSFHQTNLNIGNLFTCYFTHKR